MVKEKNEYAHFLQNLGKALGDVRKESDLTQEELGKKVSRGQSAIGKLERGPLPNVSLRVIYEVAKAISIPLSVLIKQAEQKTIAESHGKNGFEAKKLWPVIAQKVESLTPKKQDQLAKVIANVLDC